MTCQIKNGLIVLFAVGILLFSSACDASETDTFAITATDIETETEIQSDTKTVTETDITPESVLETETETDIETESVAQTETEMTTESETETESLSDSQTDTDTDTETEEEKVWIPASGKKYHSRSDCSGMKNPTEVTVDEAIDKGYEPCKRCYKE